MSFPGVFLDLSGTLVQPVFVDHPRQLLPVADAAHAVARLCEAGFRCPVVTVQSRIEKGIFSAADFQHWFDAFAADMRARGAVLLGPYVCPHRYRTPCACAKPATLLHRRAAAEWDIDLSASFTIGDTLADVAAAWDFGGQGALVAPSTPATARPPDFAGPTLTDAVDWILRQRR